MGSIAFDQAVAERLISALASAEQRLNNQGQQRSSAVTVAMEDFSGGYARLFERGADEEAADLAKLESTLVQLSRQVREAQLAAEEEKQRLDALEQWQVRLAGWESDAKSGNYASQSSYLGLMASQPSQIPITPPRISADFQASERSRTADGGASTVSSAKPDQLRSFVSTAETCHRIVSEELESVRSAWSSFRSACSWAPVDSFTLLTGFEQYALQGKLDAKWISQIADAFEVAGTGELSHAVLNLLGPALQAPAISDAQLLKNLAAFDEDQLTRLMNSSPAVANQLQLMDPKTINTWWNQLPTNGAQDQETTLWKTLPAVFGNLEGVPYHVRDEANRVVLEQRLSEIEPEYEALESRLDAANRKGLIEHADIASQKKAYTQISDALVTDHGAPARQLISLTNHQPPLAAISIGNLDTADNITYTVPGMTSSTEKMVGWTDATANVHSEASKNNPNTATVSWLGYQAPTSPLDGDGWNLDVLDNELAETGGNNLVQSFRGLHAVRGEDDPQLNAVVHSYGTTTTAFALHDTGNKIDNVVFIGSAGLPNHIDHTDDLTAEHVYAGHARDADPFPWAEDGDQWAWFGRMFSDGHHVNPMAQEFEAVTFGTDTEVDGAPVTTHSVREPGDGAGYLDVGTESLVNIGRILRNEPEKLTEHVGSGPTPLQIYLASPPIGQPLSIPKGLYAP